MTEIESKTRKLIRAFIVPNVIELFAIILVFTQLPTDPKHVWLLGFSRTRVFLMGAILLLGLALIYLFVSLSSSLPKSIRGVISWVKARSSPSYFLEIISLVSFPMLYACGYYFFSVEPADQSEMVLYLRFAPFVAYTALLFTQSYVFLAIFRLILVGEKQSLGNIWYQITLPILREKVYPKMDSAISTIADRFSHPFLTILFIIAPALLTFTLIWVNYTTTPFSYIPAGPDQVDYWHETLTFIDHGFSGGQYSVGEKIAPAQFTRFGIHGPAYPVLYGAIGKLFGWEYYSGILINMCLITLGLWGFTRGTSLDKKQLVSGVLLVSTYWPILLFLPTNMAESLNQTIAMIASVLFFHQMTARKNNWKLNATVFLLLLVAIPIRVTWALLFIPFFFYIIFDCRGYKLLGAITASLAMMLLGFYITKYLYAPFSMTFRTLLDGNYSFQNLYHVLVNQIGINLRNLVYEPDTPFFIRAFRYQFIGACIFLIYKLIKHIIHEENPVERLLRTELSFHFFNLVVPFFGVFILFEVADTRDYRNLSVSLFLSALVLLLFARYKYVYPMILINMLLFFSFLPGFAQHRATSFSVDQSRIDDFSQRVSKYMIFDKTNSNRWCNTLGFRGKPRMFMLSIDSGIGLSAIGKITENTKSKYLLLSEYYVAENQVNVESLTLIELVRTEFGILFLNPNTPCE